MVARHTKTIVRPCIVRHYWIFIVCFVCNSSLARARAYNGRALVHQSSFITNKYIRFVSGECLRERARWLDAGTIAGWMRYALLLCDIADLIPYGLCVCVDSMGSRRRHVKCSPHDASLLPPSRRGIIIIHPYVRCGECLHKRRFEQTIKWCVSITV